MIKISQLKFLNKYLVKSFFVSLVLASILLLFTIQFKVDSLTQELSQIEDEIISYNQEIEILDTEWVYLSRPERLRILANEHLKDDDYLKVSQIKDKEGFKSYNMAKYRDSQKQEMAINLK